MVTTRRQRLPEEMKKVKAITADEDSLTSSPSMGTDAHKRFSAAATAAWTAGLYLAVILAIWAMQEPTLLPSTTKQAPSQGVVCPAADRHNNSSSSSHQQLYNEQSSKIAQNWTHFLANLRNSSFDEWGKPYEQVKADMHEWKVQHYLPYLQSGDAIFESASGIGLNLLLTLEILHEHGVHNLRVEGSDFAENSVELANRLLRDTTETKNHQVCIADSTNLSYVPDETFDLVFTGYVTPNDDPLDLKLGKDQNYRHLEQVCKRRGDWRNVALHRIAQARQEQWFGQWVSELVRIAKRGSPVIVEQVSPPFCEAMHDWGGVSRSFWKEAIDRYGWDVDPSSLEFGDDHAFSTRYHVFMRKNGDGGQIRDEL